MTNPHSDLPLFDIRESLEETMQRAVDAFEEWWNDEGCVQFNYKEKWQARKAFVDGFLMNTGP